jgi:kynurenine formamidase
MRTLIKLGVRWGLVAMVLCFSIAAWAFDPIAVDEYKKWPNNWGKWGTDDEIGTLNYVTPELIVEAAKLVKQGKIIPVSYEARYFGGPVWGNRVGVERFMNWSGPDVISNPEPGLVYTDEIVKVESHGMTHVDPLGHLWWGDKMYNGYPVVDNIKHDEGMLKNNANAYLKHSAMRGVFLDVARYKGVDYLGDKYKITAEELDAVAKAQGVEIRPGDAVLIRTGFMKHWSDKIRKAGGAIRWGATTDGEPGPGCDFIAWAQEKQIGLVGADNIAVEHIVPVDEACNEKYKVPLIPLHVAVLQMLGVPLQEILDLEALSEDSAKDGVYEFFYVWAPLNFWNAAGGLMSPVAIK